MMNGYFTIGRILTDLNIRKGILVLGVLAVLTPFRASADSSGILMPALTPTSFQLYQQSSPLAEANTSDRTQQLINYVRTEAPNWAPGLPIYVRNPSGWMMSNVRQMRNELGLDKTPDSSNPLAVQISETQEAQEGATWFSPNFHHVGFLPFHDAIVLGVGAREPMFDNQLQVEAKPFYGQSWNSLEGYGGTEIAVNLIGFGLGSGGKPWGKIAVRYTEGSPDMLEYGTGTDMHAEVQFTKEISFRAGIHEGNDTGLGDYGMLRWQVTDFRTGAGF